MTSYRSLVMGRLPLRFMPRWFGAGGREAGLRTSRSTLARPPSQPEGQWLRVTRVGGSSLVTAAGPCRTCTGFPILPTGWRGTSQQFVPPPPYPAAGAPLTGHPGAAVSGTFVDLHVHSRLG